ncbi:hypothetical protein BC629DRAFT_1471413 [Irpex lacteus]|nr:hypothetical protein BC629DRAFT_1471413 [Irpex lacteus]
MAATGVSGHVEIGNLMLAYQVSKGWINTSTATYWGERLKQLKGRVFNEIISTISASLVGKDTPREPTSSAPLAPWRTRGVYPAAVEKDGSAHASHAIHGDSSSSNSEDLVGVSGRFPITRAQYQRLKSKDNPTLRFTTANICETHPLRPGSFVVFVHRTKMYQTVLAF